MGDTFSWKSGWHPKGKDGGKESWRGDFKGINQVAGWMGKGKESDSEAARAHISRPLTSLKDPASFGPPPKNVNYHGGAALPDEITPQRGGIGAPLSMAETASADNYVRSAEEPVEQMEEKRSTPALPFRADHTGLSTSSLPPPPTRRAPSSAQTAPSTTKSLQPSLPPRLPARQNSNAPTFEQTDPPPPTYETAVPTTQPSRANPSSYINQAAASRLGKAGVSVPGLGIQPAQAQRTTTDSNPWADEKSQTTSSTSASQLNGLASRFSRINTTSTATTNTPAELNGAPVAATASPTLPSWKNSQAAFQTATQLQQDPSKVTLADARNAAVTANQARNSAQAFREKHADKITGAQTKAKAFDQKYKFTSKANKFMEESMAQEEAHPSNGVSAPETATKPPSAPQNGYSPRLPAALQNASLFGQPQQSVQQPQPSASQSTTYQQGVPAALQYQSVISTPQASQGPTTSGISPSLQASIARKPPPPPAPRKPASLQAPPPVPVATRPSFT